MLVGCVVSDLALIYAPNIAMLFNHIAAIIPAGGQLLLLDTLSPAHFLPSFPVLLFSQYSQCLRLPAGL